LCHFRFGLVVCALGGLEAKAENRPRKAALRVRRRVDSKRVKERGRLEGLGEGQGEK
jgi:hypothetical protein